MNEQSRPARVPFSRLALGLLLACGLCTGPARAFEIVEDPLLIGKTVEEFAVQAERWAKTVNHYKEQLEHYQKQIEHYQQQIIKLTSLKFGTSPSLADNFAERAKDYGLEDKCPGAQKAGINALLSKFEALAPNMSGKLKEEQLKICTRMVLAENAQYNESARMLKRMVQRNEDLKRIQQQRDGQVGTSQGALAANDNEVQRFMAQNATELQYWQAKMTAYDNYIASLKDDQARLVQVAMNGNKHSRSLVEEVAGQVVQAGVLKTALSNF